MNPHEQLASSPVALLKSTMRNRQLIMQLAWREISGRYRGSLAGMAWSFLTPFFMLAIYTIFFTVIGGARWTENTGSRADYTLLLFAGLIIHSLFAECLNRAPQLIIQNSNYVKKVVFPLETLAIVTLVSALFNALISLGVLLLALLAFHQSLPWTCILLPVIWLPFLCLTLGVIWLLSALGVYIRDIAYVTPLIASVLLFLSPVFFTVASLPQSIGRWVELNPLTFVIEQSRALLLLGQAPDWLGVACYSLIGFAAMSTGFFCFQKMRKGFADVL